MKEEERLLTQLVKSGTVVCITLLVYKIVRGRELIISSNDISILIGILVGVYIRYMIRKD